VKDFQSITNKAKSNLKSQINFNLAKAKEAEQAEKAEKAEKADKCGDSQPKTPLSNKDRS